MDEILNSLTIGMLATTAGVNVETIRFYQRRGLLMEPERPHGGIRRYGDAEVNRIKFVKSAQRLGFSLDEVAELLKLEDGTHCDDVPGSINVPFRKAYASFLRWNAYASSTKIPTSFACGNLRDRILRGRQ